MRRESSALINFLIGAQINGVQALYVFVNEIVKRVRDNCRGKWRAVLIALFKGDLENWIGFELILKNDNVLSENRVKLCNKCLIIRYENKQGAH